MGRTLTGYEEFDRILKARSLAEEPNRAFIKWPKKKKKFKIKRKTTPSLQHPHPGTKEARQVLATYGRDLTICENCGRSNVRMDVHHIDRNPYNNRIENLRVLCQNCHRKAHSIDLGIIDETSEISDEFGKIPPEDKELESETVISVQEEELPTEILNDVLGEDQVKTLRLATPCVLKQTTSLKEFKSSKFYGLQCRLCAHYRAFKSKCYITNEETYEFKSACVFFEDR